MSCPKFSKEFERWYNHTVKPTLNFENAHTMIHKEIMFVGWQACQAQAIQEIYNSVSFYQNASYSDPMVQKSSLVDRIKSL